MTTSSKTTDPPAAPRPAAPRWLVIATAVVAAGILIPSTWLGVRAFIAYDALLNAQSRVDSARSELSRLNTQALPFVLDDMQRDIDLALGMMSDPVWGFVESTPIVGENLRAVREVTAELSVVVNNGLAPLVMADEPISIDAFRPVSGVVDLARVDRILASLDDAFTVVSASSRAVSEIDADGLIGPVAAQITGVQQQFATAADAASGAIDAMTLVPGVFGTDGTRTYLVVLHDSLADRAVGGAPLSVTPLSLIDGRITVEETEPLDASLGTDGASTLERLSTEPGFVAFAVEVSRLWQQRDGRPVDAVISMDTVALASLVGAAGTVRDDQGGALSTPDAAELLLNTATSSGSRTDVAGTLLQSTLSAVVAGDGPTTSYVAAAASMVSNKRLKIWSALEAEQSLVQDSPVSGELRAANDPLNTYGLFVNAGPAENSSAPISLEGRLDGAGCDPSSPQASTFTINATPLVDAPSSAAVEILLVGPVGSTIDRVSVNGETSSESVRHAGAVNGRPTVGILVTPSAGAAIVVQFLVADDETAFRANEVFQGARIFPAPLTVKSC